jgi:hypothetical protein
LEQFIPDRRPVPSLKNERVAIAADEDLVGASG